MKPVSPLLQRYPFLPLVLLASAGILAAEFLPWPGVAWGGIALAAAAAFFLSRRTLAFAAVIVATFATVHLWQSRESAASELARQIQGREWLVEAEGVVASEPRILSEKFSSFELRLRRLRVDDRNSTPPATILVTWPGTPPAYGDVVRATGTLGPIAPPRNPGQFDFAAWCARKGIFSNLVIAHTNDTEILARHQGSFIVALALRIRENMKQTLTAGIDDPVVANLLVGMVLGDVSELPEPIQEEFRGTGTFHLFSVSGLHVGMLAAILWFVLRIARIPRQHAALIIIPTLFFYALMTGLGPASVRSAVMGAIVIGGFLARRPALILNNLFAAGFLILLWDTNQLFSAGFQLSFSVVAMIVLLAPLFTARLESLFLPDPFIPRKLLSRPQRLYAKGGEKFASLAAVSLAAWLGSLPLTLGYFHLVSFTALPANLLAVPISFGIMIVAILSLVAGIFNPGAAVIFNNCNLGLSWLLLGVVHFFASLPGAFFFVGTPAFPRPAAEIVVFDFGAGGATWINAAGRSWLLDCGPQRRHDSVLLPFLRAQGLRSLDGLILTHGDSTHIGAAPDLFSSCPPGTVIDSVLNDRSSNRDRVHRELAQHNRPKSLHRAGDRLTLGPGVEAHILYPPGGITSRVADDKALVIRLDVGATRILFLSDAGLAVEDWLLAHDPASLRADILVKGTPRGGPSGSPPFLDAVNPDVVIASSADYPTSEKITPDFARQLAARGIAFFRQDECGAVTLKIYPRHFEVSGFVNGRQYARAQ